MERICDECVMDKKHCPALGDMKAFKGITRQDVCNDLKKEKDDKGFTLIELIVVLIIVLIIGSVIVGSCSQVFFNATISGIVVDNQQLGSGQAGFFASQDAKEIAFSRAVNIKTTDDQDYVFSTVDRRFFVVKPGDCVKVKVFIYPPWMISKAGSMYNGRLIKKWNCTKSER